MAKETICNGEKRLIDLVNARFDVLVDVCAQKANKGNYMITEKTSAASGITRKTVVNVHMGELSEVLYK